MNKLSQRGSKRLDINISDHVIIIALLIFWVILIISNPAFQKFAIFASIIKQASIYAVCGIGMTFAIISGAFDLSVASQIALSSVIFTSIVIKIIPAAPGLGIVLTCVILIIMGLGMGLINGLLIARLRIPAFIVTLAMQKIYRGLAQFVNNAPVPIATFGPEYQGFTSGGAKAITWNIGKFEVFYIKGFSFTKILGLPLFFYIMLALAIVGTIVLRKTRLGRNIIAIGNSREAARIAGINIPNTETITFVLVGLFTALAGIMMTAHHGSSKYGVPTGTEFTVISAVVLGGTALAGGKGSILNTVVASLFIATIPTALTTFGVPNEIQGVFNGIILVFAFSINTIRTYADNALVKYRAKRATAAALKAES